MLTNYVLVEKIGETPHASIFKAYSKREPERLLTLKIFRTGSLSEMAKGHIRQKVEHLRILNDPVLLTPIMFGDREGSCYISQDFFDGVTLDRLIDEHRGLALDDFLDIACQLALALEKVHEAGIIHGGVKPHNILVGRGREVRLTDFITAVDVRDVSHFIYDRSFIRDTLAYTSPEQTGRINHRVVFSSDLYSLGIVLYEMLTGRVPFLSDDPLELIHQHLAREAPKVHELRPEVPVVLSNIVAKLMLKEPEKRYQSSRGLYDDLARCRDDLAAHGAMGVFPLERSVCTHRVTFISKMVGRDTEAKTILSEYERVTAGEFRSLFISGLSGIGKTRLIQELQRPIVKHRGYFTSGKFDVYQRNSPYSSLIQALSGLLRTFLTESEERVGLWRQRMLDAVGPNGKVLTDVIPELEVLIGVQPAVKELPPVESLNRFHDLFDRFLGCLASEENPLTLFIDDLQWCDVASFDFLANLFANHGEHPYLFLLGAYRDNEVDPSHPLAKLIRNIRENHWPLKEVSLGPLRPEDCHEMVAYILDSPLQQTKALSNFLSALTEGNPLFVSESLSYLHNEDLLYLDEGRQWRWDLDRIRRSRMPTNVVALFSSKMQRFPPELREMLERCAIMGNTFSPSELSLITEKSLVEVFETLKPALGQGLLMESKGQLRFIHDKVQEAALATIPAERRRQIHRQVGEHLLAMVPSSADMEKVDNLFTIVSHLNLGRDEELDTEAAYLLSALNYHAGNRALNSLATEAANEHFNLGRELLPGDCWEDAHYVQTFRIYQRAAKTELMCGNYERSEKLLEHLLEHARTDLDKAECLAEQTTSLSSVGNFIKAIETANRGLAYFGKAIPEDPDEADRRRHELMTRIESVDADVCDVILNMPFTTDRRSKIELAFYSELIPDLYMSGLVPQLYLSAAQSTQHCLTGGMDESVIYSFSIMGLQLGEVEEFERAFRYEDLARSLSAKYPNTFGATRGMNGVVWCNMHSRSHPREIVEYCLRSIQCGKNCGDLYNAGLSYGPLMWNLQVWGSDLSAIEDYARECLQFSNRFHLSFSAGLAEAVQAGWVEPMRRGGAATPMDEKIRKWESDDHIASAGSYFVHLALAHYYRGEHQEAAECLSAVERYLSGLTDNVLKRQWYAFRALNAIKLYEMGVRFESEEQLRSEIRPLVRKIESWAALGPLLRPYLAFIRAELERVTGKPRDARGLYLDALDMAEEQGYTLLQGHVSECLGELLGRAGRGSGKLYLSEAVRLYRQCRATRKESLLLERHPELLDDDERPVPQAEERYAAQTLPDLDVEYLMKAALAISSEIEQDALLREIMSVVMESSGAQHGYLLTEGEGDLVVRAEGHGTERDRVLLADRRLEESGVCRTIARYVYRTGERLILGSAAREGPFKESPEVQEMQLRSVLCLPVIKQSKTVAVLYLENRLADNVFTPGKTGMTEMLASHAAVSLENAALFEEHRRAEEALLDAQREWENTFDHIPDLIAILDADHNIVRANKAMLQRLGSPGSERFKGLKCYQCVHGTDGPPSFCPHSRTLTDGKEHVAEVHEEALGGDFLVSTTPLLDSVGKVRGTVHVARNITERKKMEKEITEKAKSLARSNAELQQFAYVASHDLQEPLRTVTSYLSLFERKFGDQLSGEAREYLHYAVEGGIRARTLIRDLLDYSRVDSRGIPAQPTSMDEVLCTVTDSLKALIEDEGAEVVRGPLPTIMADKGQMAALLQNLVGNAIKFHGDERPVVRLSCEESGNDWLFSVQDNGIGIDPKYREQVFQLFRRLHASDRYPGTGIGLAVAKKIVERHGGRIWFESEMGKGTTFFFTIPRGVGGGQ